MATALATLATPTPMRAQARLDKLDVASVGHPFKLGAFDDPVLAFSRVVDLAIGPDDRIYVVQADLGEVTVLSRDGRLSTRIGGKGQGPGEFISPGAIGWVGDTLWVLDVAGRRVTYFDGGRVVGTHTYRSITLGPREDVATQIPLDQDRYLGVLVRRPLRSGPTNGSAPLISIKSTASGEVIGVDTIGILRESYPLRIYIGSGSASPMYTDFPIFHVSRDGRSIVVVARPFSEGDVNRIRVTRLTPSGDTVFSRELESPVVPLTDAAWRAREAQMDKVLANSGIDRHDYYAASRRPAGIASVSRMTLGQQGWIWLALEDRPGAAMRRWIALDDSGRPQFAVDLPRSFRMYDASKRELWGVEPDSLGVPYIERFDILGRPE